MLEWINEMLPRFLTAFSVYGLGLVFLAGVASSIGPCNMSIIPVIISYVGGTESGRQRSFILSVLFALGTAMTFMILGLIIAGVGGIFGSSRSILYYFVAAICITIGLNLTGVWKFNISFGGQLLSRLGEQKGPGGSFLLGMVMGLVGSQCGTPVLLAILSLAMASGQCLYGALLLFVYALGRGVPIVAVGTFTGLLTRMEQFARWNSIMEKVAGVLIIIMGTYFAWIA